MVRRPRLGASDNASLELVATLNRGDLAKLRLLAKASRLEAAKALTFTAERAMPAWRAGHSVFHRRNSWIDKGVRMRPATPGNMEARVGTVDDYMQRHVTGLGETKRGKGRALFIPVYDQISEVGTHTQIRRKLKGYAKTKRKTFLIPLNGGGALVARRKGRARTPLQILAKLQPQSDTTPSLDARSIVAGVTAREFGLIYERLLVKWAERD